MAVHLGLVLPKGSAVFFLSIMKARKVSISGRKSKLIEF